MRNGPGVFGGMYQRESLETWDSTYEKSGAEVSTVLICRLLSDGLDASDLVRIFWAAGISGERTVLFDRRQL